jgi:hypothetical protein
MAGLVAGDIIPQTRPSRPRTCIERRAKSARSPDQTGRVWVGDDRGKKLVMSHPVKAGDQVEIDPKKDQVKINGRIVFSQNLESRHGHFVFWMGR